MKQVFCNILHIVDPYKQSVFYFKTTWFDWLVFLAGSGSFSEMILPTIGIILCLRISGGRYVLPLMLYWMSVVIFSIGMYIVDFPSQIDMLAYGKNGDWAFILEVLRLSPYTHWIGNGVIFLSIACFVLAVWSFFYYFRHQGQYPIPNGAYW